jgi:hypothetical protein
MPAVPNVVPPGNGIDGASAVKDGLRGGAVGGAIGAVVGLVAAGPIGAAALAGFFAAGGGLAGLLAGASGETAVEASELRQETSGVSPPKPHPLVEELEKALRAPAVSEEIRSIPYQIAQRPAA